MSAEGFSAALSLAFDDTCGYQRSLFALVQSPTSTVLQFSQDSLQRFWVSANPTVAPVLRTCQVFLQRLCKLAASPSASSMMRLLVALHWLLIVAGDVELNPGPIPSGIAELMPTVDDSQLTEDNLCDVLEEVWSLAGRWRSMCLVLRLSNADTIASSYHDKPGDCLRATIEKWLKKVYNTQRHGPPTWRKLVGAVANNIGGDNPALAETIAVNHRCTAQSARSIPQPRKLSTDSSNTVILQFTQYLRSRYQALMPTFFTLQWPPPPTRKTFNLAMIRGQNIPYGPIDEDMVRRIQQGKVKDILYHKIPVELKDILQMDSNKRKVVLIEGAAGSGKSTLAWHVCQTWGSGKLFQDFRSVVYVQLRDPAILSCKAVEDIIPAVSRNQAEMVMKEFRTCGGQDLLLVLDGWDELPSHLRAESIFQKLIAFPEALNLHRSTVVITSRPIASSYLYHHISSRIEILGFTPTEVKDYFTEALGGERQALKLQDQLNECPMVECSCYLPVNAAIISHLFMAHNYSLPTTLHEIFTLLVRGCLQRHVAKQVREEQRIISLDNLPLDLQKFFEDICTLAYYGVMDNRVIFSEEYLESRSLPKISETLGLIQGVESFTSLERSTSFYFLHRSVQELLASFYISKLPANKQLLEFNKLFGEPRYAAVFRFYAAFTKLETDEIRKIVADIVQKKENHQLLYLLHGIYEAHTPSLCQFVGSKMGGELNLNRATLSSVDCQTVGYFISCICLTTNGEFKASLQACSLDAYRVGFLTRELSKCIGSSSMHEANLTAAGAGVSSCLELTLDLSDNNIGYSGVVAIAELLRQNKILQTLDLRSNQISDEGAKVLLEALRVNQSLTQLSLSGNQISHEGETAIAEALKDNQSLRKPEVTDDEDCPDDAVQEISELLYAVDEVMQKKGKLEQTILQGVFIGPPRNGKSSLMKRLLNQELPSSSTDVVETPQVTQVTFKKPTMSTANISSDATVFTWSELSFDDEVVTLLKALSKNTDFSKGKTVTEELPTPKPQFEVDTLDVASEEMDVGKIHAGIERSSSYSPTAAPAITFAQEIPDIPEAKFKTHQEVFKESLQTGWSEAKKYFENACTMYLTDTGGQLEFQELLPALVSGPSVFFLVFRLDWDLNTEFTVHYSHSEKGQAKPYLSSIKLKDALLQSLASIAAMGTFACEGQQMEKLQPRIFFVGTHKDKVSEDRIAEIDMELQKAIESTSFFRSGLVQPASDDRILLTVNNLSDNEDDSGIKQVRKAVERIIYQDHFKVRAPPQWLIFSLVLRQTIDQPVISYAQCRSLASNCGINDSEELDKALWFLSTRVGLIRYYRNASEDLRNLIILDPSIIFRKISKLVIETFTFENLLVHNQSVCKDFVDKGLFWLNDFVNITKKSGNELLTAPRLIDLLQHLHIIARIQKVGGNTKLFMPCILKSTASKGYQDSEASEVPPLLVCFDCGYCPKGIFPALVAYLLNHDEKESEYLWILQEKEVYKNQISFTVSHCTVSLKVAPTFIKVLCIPNDPTTCHKVCMSLKQGISQVTSDLQYAMDAKWCFGFVCRCCKEYHGAELRGKVGEHNCHLLCPISKKPSTPPIGFEIWFPKQTPGSTHLAASTETEGDHPQTTQTTYLDPSPSKRIKTEETTTKTGYNKLQCQRDTIIESLADLGLTRNLAEKLLGAKMITRHIYDQANNFAAGVVEVNRATVLFNAVLARVKLKPAKYGEFIALLKLIPGSDDLVDFIEDA